ncbi:MAG: DUF2125 domain-containing protein [Rhodospirillales bacterium]|nr:DUF2125 domain-containing protein [Rhodospirillales bacterium]
MRRFLSFFLIGVPVVILLAATGYWWLAEQRLEAGFTAWRHQAEAAGWQVAAGSPGHGGWPFDARLDLRDVSLTGGTAVMPGGLALQAPRLALDIGLFSLPYTLRILPRDPVLRLGAASPIVLHAERFTITVTPQQGAAPVVDVAGKSVTLTPQGASADHAVGIGLLQAHTDLPAASGGAVLHYTSSLEAILLPAGQRWALGRHLSSISLEGSLGGLAALQPGAPSARALAAAWQKAGGVLDLKRLAMGWGPLGLSLAGSARLDDGLQPVMSATARIVGYAGTLQALARGGVISADAAGAAAAVLGLLAHAPEGGGPSEVVVPVRLQAGQVSIGGVPVARPGSVDWNGAAAR